MQIRCQYCHRPYALSKEVVHEALDVVTAQNQHHFDAPCPHCGKVNHISRAELQRAAPDWGKKRDHPEPK